MVPNIILCGLSAMAAAVVLWSLAVALRRRTPSGVRAVAYRIFRLSWMTFVVTTVSAIIRLYATGVL